MQLNNFGVSELSMDEMQEIEGGLFWIVVAAVVIIALTPTPAY